MERTEPRDATPRRTRSPLTDPRALFSSVTFHAIVWVGAAAMAAVGASLPRSEVSRPRVLHAEIGPVDNRAPAESAGGSAGELGGDGSRPTVDLRAEPPAERRAAADSIAERLLAETLPGTLPPEPAPGALPGPTTTGLGLLVGSGAGGGGGEGGGAGGGVGSGFGPGTEFFGAREEAGSFAYVIDCSGSMIQHDALDVAKRELLSSLSQLPPDARFGVVFYNLRPTILTDENDRPGLMQASGSNKDRLRSRLAAIGPDGGTRPREALEAALGQGPEVVYLLTDGQELTHEDVDHLRDQSGPTRIHTIEFGGGIPPEDGSPLSRLALETGGTYRHIDVRTFGRSARDR